MYIATTTTTSVAAATAQITTTEGDMQQRTGVERLAALIKITEKKQGIKNDKKT